MQVHDNGSIKKKKAQKTWVDKLAICEIVANVWLLAAPDFIVNVVLVSTSVNTNLKCDYSTEQLTLLRQVT